MTAGFDGAAVLLLSPDERTGNGPEEVPVEISLRGAFQPLDGRFHWYGRIGSNERLPSTLSGREVLLRTPYGEGAGRLSDVDPWGRHRISGTGRPPFTVDPGD